MERDHLYRDYITVVFGLVATKGLEQLSDSALKNELSRIQAPFFLGAFIVGIHYWYVCASFAGVSSTTYGVLSEKISTKQFLKNLSNIILFGLPVLFVSAYAGAVVMFFYAIPAHNYGLLFQAFAVLLAVSWINDAWDIAIAIYAKKKTNIADEKAAIDNQRNLSLLWLVLDFLFFALFATAYHWIVSLAAAHPLRDGALFLGLVAIGVVFDAALTPLDKKNAPQHPTASAPKPAPVAAPALPKA